MSELQIDPRQLSPTASWSVETGSMRVLFGEGSLARLGEQAGALGCRSVLLVSDPGIHAAGHVTAAERSLREAAIGVSVFDDVVPNPSTRHVEAGRRAAAAAEIDGIVAVGGGSAMDCAKGINFLLTNGGRMEDYWGRNKATRPMLPSIGVPTTAGTGSEAQSFALISQAGTGAKMACGDPKARFRAVILDPSLISSVPRPVAAANGIDAISHAVESYVCRARNPVSQLFGREAWRLLEDSLEAYLACPADPAVCARMQLGAYFAGAAIEHSMLGAAHACANPLTARFGVTHGIAVGLMLPAVIRFNADEVGELYDELSDAAAPRPGRTDLGQRVRALRAAAELPARLRDHDIPADSLDALAAEAATQWTADFNPRAVGQRELRELYEAAY